MLLLSYLWIGLLNIAFISSQIVPAVEYLNNLDENFVENHGRHSHVLVDATDHNLSDTGTIIGLRQVTADPDDSIVTITIQNLVESEYQQNVEEIVYDKTLTAVPDVDDDQIMLSIEKIQQDIPSLATVLPNSEDVTADNVKEVVDDPHTVVTTPALKEPITTEASSSVQDPLPQSESRKDILPVDASPASIALSEAEKANRRVADQYILMSRAYLSRQAIDKALKELHKAIHRAPEYLDAYFIRGKTLMQIQQWVSAADDFLTVLQLTQGRNTTAVDYCIDISEYFIQQRQYNEAINILSVLYAMHNSSIPSTHLSQDDDGVVGCVRIGQLFGHVLLEAGRGEKALAVYESCPTLLRQTFYQPSNNSNSSNTGDRQSLLLLASLYEQSHRYKDSEGVLLHARRLQFITISELGYFYARNNDAVAAIEQFQQALATDEENIEYIHMLGVLLTQQQNYTAAKVYFESSLARGYVSTDMRRYFALHDPFPAGNFTKGYQIGEYLLHRVAHRGGMYRHRWVVRALERRLVSSPGSTAGGSTSPGDSMRGIRSLGSRSDRSDRSINGGNSVGGSGVGMMSSAFEQLQSEQAADEDDEDDEDGYY